MCAKDMVFIELQPKIPKNELKTDNESRFFMLNYYWSKCVDVNIKSK